MHSARAALDQGRQQLVAWMQVLAVCWSAALSDCWEAARSGRHHAKAAPTTVSAEWPKEPQEGTKMIADEGSYTA